MSRALQALVPAVLSTRRRSPRSNGWRLRRVHEAAEAEANDWYHYPSGRVYHTPLRTHMKELVNQIIEEAEKDGYRSTRCALGGHHAS